MNGRVFCSLAKFLFSHKLENYFLEFEKKSFNSCNVLHFFYFWVNTAFHRHNENELCCHCVQQGVVEFINNSISSVIWLFLFGSNNFFMNDLTNPDVVHWYVWSLLRSDPVRWRNDEFIYELTRIRAKEPVIFSFLSLSTWILKIHVNYLPLLLFKSDVNNVRCLLRKYPGKRYLRSSNFF